MTHLQVCARVTQLIDVWHDPFTCVTWLIYVWYDSFTCVTLLIYMWHDSFTCVTWLIYVRHDPFTYADAQWLWLWVTWRIHLWHDSFTRVTLLICMWRGSFTCVTGLMYVRHDPFTCVDAEWLWLCVTWRIHLKRDSFIHMRRCSKTVAISDMTHSSETWLIYLWHDSPRERHVSYGWVISSMGGLQLVGSLKS